MAENSKIAWTTHTFNPWMGCSKVSDGCKHCYAENLMDTRYGKVKWGPTGTRTKTTESNWRKPIAWDRAAKAAGERARVFCASLADVCENWGGNILNAAGEVLYRLPDGKYQSLKPGQFHLDSRSPATMDDLRMDLFRLVEATPNLDWLILTKRADRTHLVPALPNVWMGVSIEDAENDYRWKNHLQHETRFAVRWISAEPLLGRLPIENWANVPDWIIFGGESDQGQPARACSAEWIRDGIRLCRERGIMPFVKQLGSNAYDPPANDFDSTNEVWRMIELKDKAGADPIEWPEDLRVREFPKPVLA